MRKKSCRRIPNVINKPPTPHIKTPLNLSCSLRDLIFFIKIKDTTGSKTIIKVANLTCMLQTATPLYKNEKPVQKNIPNDIIKTRTLIP